MSRICLLFGTVASNHWRNNVITRDVAQYRALVALLILVLLVWWTLLNSLSVLLVLSVGAFQFEYLRKKSL
jgi:uncharacterized integral membrane protein